MANALVYYDILEKIKRANKHINDLESFWATCRKAHPSGTRTERDPQSGDITYFIADMTPIPPDISIITGDAIQNLRTALDHLVYAMAVKKGAKLGTHLAFPIFDTDVEYAHPKDGAVRKIGGLGSLAIQEFDRLQPYKGGNEKLWLLHKLNNIDKHRLLITVGHHIEASTLLPSEKRKYAAAYRIGHPGSEPLQFSGLFMNLAQPKSVAPLKIGDKICTVPAQDADENMDFSIGIAFNEIDVTRGNSIFLILRLISGEVEMIVNDMARFL